MSKLLFKNSIGKLYDDKLVINKYKVNSQTIDSLYLIFFADKKKNIIFFIIGSLGLMGSYFLIQEKTYFYSSNIVFSLVFASSMFYNEKKYYFKVILIDKMELVINVRKNQKGDAKELLSQFNKIVKKQNSAVINTINDYN